MTDHRTTARPVRMGFGSGGRPTGESAQDPRATTFRMFGYLKPYRRQLAVVAALVIIGTLSNLTGPILLGRAIDQYIASGDITLACYYFPGYHPDEPRMNQLIRKWGYKPLQ